MTFDPLEEINDPNIIGFAENDKNQKVVVIAAPGEAIGWQRINLIQTLDPDKIYAATPEETIRGTKRRKEYIDGIITDAVTMAEEHFLMSAISPRRKFQDTDQQETTMAYQNWDEAAKYTLDLIFQLVVDCENPQALRDLIDDSITHLYNNPLHDPEVAIDQWELIGSAAITLSTEIETLSCEEVLDTIIRKQRDYGHENIRRFGLDGLLVRCHDKIARLENLYGKNLDPQNESLRDTLLDIVGYSAIGVMWERGEFLLPLAPEKNL